MSAGQRTPSPLYGWQAEALDQWRTADRRGIVEAVTGTGKTRVAVEAIREHLDRRGRCLVLVPTIDLQDQWVRELEKHLGRIGIGRLGGGRGMTLFDRSVVVAVVNSARNPELQHPTYQPLLLVADECHRYASEENRRALRDEFESRLGLTATLERPDRLENELVDYFGPRSFRMGYGQALADEVVAHFSVALVGVPMSTPEADKYDQLTSKIGGLFHTLTSEHGFPRAPHHTFLRAVQDAARGEWCPEQGVARDFLKTTNDRKMLLATSPSKQRAVTALTPAIEASDRTLIFTESIDTAEAVANDLRERGGLTAAALHSGHLREDRREYLDDFRNDRIQVLCAPRVLDEGIDVPAADLAVIVAASKTRRQMIQRMGRVLRRKDDDRIARFAILFLEGTTEDPRYGAHEAFLSEVTSVCDDLDVIPVRRAHEINEFLAITEPLEPPAPRRLEGEPPRSWIEGTDDESLDSRTVLGLSTMSRRRR